MTKRCICNAFVISSRRQAAMPRFSIILDRVWASGGIPESGGKRKPPLGGQRRAAISSPAIAVMRGNPRAARIRSEIKNRLGNSAGGSGRSI
jgi:hypothetical protein